MKRVTTTLAMTALMTACSPSPPDAAFKPASGADRDAHGCTASAGYSWSLLRGQCIRIFEVGVAFVPYDEKINPTQQAFVVMPEPGPATALKAELHLPGKDAPMALEAVPVPEGETRPTVLENKAEGVTIEYERDDYLLYIKGQLAFYRHGQDNTLLDALLAKR